MPTSATWLLTQTCLTHSPPFSSLQSSPAALATVLFLDCVEHIPSSGVLHLQFPLLEYSSPSYKHMVYSLSSIWSMLKWPPYEWGLPFSLDIKQHHVLLIPFHFTPWQFSHRVTYCVTFSHLFIISYLPLKCRSHWLRNLSFLFSGVSSRYSLEQCFTYGRCSINDCWRKECCAPEETVEVWSQFREDTRLPHV